MKRARLVLTVSLLLIVTVFAAAASALPLRTIERRIVIHRYAKPPWAGGPKPSENGHSNHYATFGKGVVWKTLPVEYVIDPDNPNDLTAQFVTSAITAAAQEWDSHTSAVLFAFGGKINDGSWDDEVSELDGRNEVLFDIYPDSNVIAVTAVWGYFSGPVPYREIVEFDILLNIFYDWGDGSIDKTVMDVQNIATHELGHGVGLADIYNCPLETMYGYSTFGETIKQTLYDGDIAGIQKLYGT
ncbi:MAG: matrixin family metalloprotease [Nitrososphaeria archaeon]